MNNAEGERLPAISAMGEGGPWGNPDEDSTTRGNREGPRNPWSPPPRGSNGPNGDRGPSAIDEMIRRARDSFGGGLPGGQNGGRLWLFGIVGAIVLWAAFTSAHSIGAKQRGVVSFLGSYSRTLDPGFNLTLPSPLESVTIVETDQIRSIELGSAAGDQSEKLMLTGDQNVIDIGYSVLWKVSDPKAYLFQIAEPDETIAEVAESAMRAVIATVRLQDALGAGRNDIEQQVQLRSQEILDQYNAGVQIERVAIKQADPPQAVNDAFKEVSAAQQDADTYINQANAYSQQLSAQSQGEAAAFEKVYEQYRLAPEVTRRRMYYETMERVLSGVNKTVVEADGVTPYLPLPQMTRRPSVTTVENPGGRP